jgi:uncharacterized SAM-binding protein YcdF (DUF218 family)
MFFYLSKLIDFLIHPLVWILGLILLGIIKKEKGRKFIMYALAILYFFSNQFIFNEVARLYEPRPQNLEENGESYSAAIVLGGLSSYQGEIEQLEFQESADRLLDVLPLYFKGRVKKIIIAGGSGRLVNQETESPHLKRYLIEIGVKEKDILIEARSRNTYENAIYSKKLIEVHKLKGPFLLSTSAAHMPRSLACFEKQGLKVIPFPNDYLSRKREFNPDRLLVPNAFVLKSWDAIIHEWIGWLSYKIAGYC